MTTVVNETKMTDALTDMRNSLENMDASETVTIGSPSIGDVVRQGDLYLECIETLPDGEPTGETQLAIGSTQGANHVITSGYKNGYSIVNVKSHTTNAGVEVNPVLIGPAFKCVEECELTHPEHGNKILPAGTVWQVVFQQAYSDEVRRVAD